MPEVMLPPTTVIIRLQYLPLTATASDVRSFFQGLRIPEGGVHIIGGENGDVFVGFASDEDARQAMRRDRGTIHGQEIRLLLSSRSEMLDVMTKAKCFHHNADRDQTQISKKPSIGSEENKNSWKSSNAPSSSSVSPSTYAPDSDYNKPAYARMPPNTGAHEPYNGIREPPIMNGFNGHVGQRGGDTGHPKFYENEHGPPFNRMPQNEPEPLHRFYGGPPTKDPRSTFPPRMPPGNHPEMKQDYGEGLREPKMPPMQRGGMHGGAPPLMRNNFPQNFPPKHGGPPDRHLDIGKDNRDMGYMHNMPQGKPACPPIRNENWRKGGRTTGRDERVWDSRFDCPGKMPPNHSMKSDAFEDLVNRKKPLMFHNNRGGLINKPSRHPPNGYPEHKSFTKKSEAYLELSRLPNEMLRPSVLEHFLKPSVPLSLSSVKIVYSPEGILMHALVRLECEDDAKSLLSRDGEQGIKIRQSSKHIFDEAVDSPIIPAPVVPDLYPPNNPEIMKDRGDYKRRRSRSPDDRRRRRDRRSRSRERDIRRSRSPPLKRGRQEPNRWCLLMTNVPFRMSEGELRTWLSEKVNPSRLIRTYYANGNASDRWIAEFDTEPSLERAKALRSNLQGRIIKMSYIDNDYADELMKIEDKYGDAKRTENELKMMAEIQMQQLNGGGPPEAPPVQHFPTPAFRGGRGFPRGRHPLTGASRGRGMPSLPPPIMSHNPPSYGNAPPFMRGGGGGSDRGGGSGGGRGNGNGRGGAMQRSGHFFNSKPIPPREPEERAEQPNREDEHLYNDMPAVDRDMASSLGEKGCVVSCYGFPPDLTLQDVVGFFEGYPVDENSIRMRMGEGGVGTGECLLALNDAESAQRAVLCLNGKSLRGHSVRLMIAA